MTTTIVISVLFGAVVGFPLLKRWRRVGTDILGKIERGVTWGLFPVLLLGAMWALFALYSWGYAILLIMAMHIALVAAGGDSLLGYYGLTVSFMGGFAFGFSYFSYFMFLQVHDLSWFAMLVLGGVSLFLCVVALFHLVNSIMSISIMPHLFKEKWEIVCDLVGQDVDFAPVEKWHVVRNSIVVFTLIAILISEGLLANATNGRFPAHYPTLCAWIYNKRAVPVLISDLLIVDPEGGSSFDSEVHWNNDKIRVNAELALEGIGKRATPMLIDLLKSRDYDVRGAVAKTLGNIGDKSAVPALEAADPKHHKDFVEQFCPFCHALHELGAK